MTTKNILDILGIHLVAFRSIYTVWKHIYKKKFYKNVFEEAIDYLKIYSKLFIKSRNVLLLFILKQYN